MEKLVTVTLINGKRIMVLPQEVDTLIAAGKIAPEREKEYKSDANVITKDLNTPKPPAPRREKPPKLPVNISSKNVKK